MSLRTATRIAWSACAFTLSVLAFALSLMVLGWSTPLPDDWTPWRDQVISVVGIIGAPILGGLIASRRPLNPYGWLWLAFGLGLALQLLAESYLAYALAVEPGTLPAPQLVSRLVALGGPLALSCAPFLLLLFPTGRSPSRRWRPLAWVATASGAMLVFLNLLFDRPDEVGGVVAIMTVAAAFAIFTAILLSALSLVVRYRGASGVERQQLKWFALAAILVAFSLVGQLLGEALWNLLDAVAITALYVTVGVAILKYRLYDIDLIINRTLVYGSSTAVLVGVYVGSIVALQGLLRALTGQESQLAIVVSTLAVVALFNPLRRRIQTFIDRRFYREKYDARNTLEAFSIVLRDETDLEALDAELVGLVAGTMQPAHVSLWLRYDGPTRASPTPGTHDGRLDSLEASGARAYREASP